MRTTYAYPLQSDGKGGLLLSQDWQCDRDSIYSVIFTRPGERVERPALGSPDFLFEAVADDVTIPGQLEAALIDQIPTAQQIEVYGSISEEGVLDLSIGYVSGESEQVEAIRIS
jgi:hypothetical protein